MIQLIVNADDLGSGPQRDRGIFAAFAGGIVTSASLLANGASLVSAAREALACGLPVGVHLNLSEGKALVGPIAGLTDATGNFPGKITLRSILLNGQLARDTIRRELLAQIECVRTAGLVPDHLDTHQHCLLFPTLTGVVTEVAKASGIRALRLPLPAGSSEENGCFLSPKNDATNNLAAELALYRELAPKARKVISDAGAWTPDGLWGMPLLNRLDTASLADTLARIPAGTWELMTHPGYVDPGDPFGGREREAELTALTAPEIRRLIVERDIQLTSFGACACGC